VNQYLTGELAKLWGMCRAHEAREAVRGEKMRDGEKEGGPVPYVDIKTQKSHKSD